MKTKEAIKASRQRRLVPDNKFDRHMKRARLQDIDSRAKIMCEQTLDSVERMDEHKNIPSSIY